MTKILTRKQNIRKAKYIHNISKFILRLKRIQKKSVANEVYIETSHGKVRTLWYGFDQKEIKPIFFDMHGGGFVLGSADIDENMNLKIMEAVGCKIISIDYAKAPYHPYPTAVNQTYEVVKHVYENSQKYGIDNKRMAIGGHSAGANLSTVTCLKSVQGKEFEFKCQVLDYPPLDMATSPLDKPQPKGCINPKMAMMFDASYVETSKAKEIFVSPVYSSQEELEGLPPAIFILPGMDSLHDEGVKYCNMLKEAGVEVEFYEYPEALHGFTYRDSEDTSDALNKMISFLKAHLY